MVVEHVEMALFHPVYFFLTSCCFLRQNLIKITMNFYLSTTFQTELFSMHAVTETMKICFLFHVIVLV